MVFRQKNKAVNPITLKINNEVIERVSQIKYLGLVVDDRFTWY